MQKVRTRPAVVLKRHLGNVQILRDITGSQLMIRLKYLKFSYTGKYFRCIMAYSGLPYESGKYLLHVYGKYYLWYI